MIVESNERVRKRHTVPQKKKKYSCHCKTASYLEGLASFAFVHGENPNDVGRPIDVRQGYPAVVGTLYAAARAHGRLQR